MKVLLCLVCLLAPAGAAPAVEGGEDGSWGKDICAWLGARLLASQAKAQNDSLAACNMFQQHYIQSCAADDVPAEAAAMAKDSCSFIGNWLAKAIPPLKGLFAAPKGSAYKACLKAGPAFMAKAINTACKGGKVDPSTLCPSVFCNIWGTMEKAASAVLHCNNLPLPAMCQH